jgi:hypothetical protein
MTLAGDVADTWLSTSLQMAQQPLQPITIGVVSLRRTSQPGTINQTITQQEINETVSK